MQSVSAADPGPAARDQSVDPARLAAVFRSSALNAAGRLLDAALDGAEEDLFRIETEADYDPDVVDACAEARLLARDERARLTMVFIQVLGEGLSGQGGASEPGDEALLPSAEAEEAVRAGEMAGRLIEQCAADLEPLEARLANLAGSGGPPPTAISPTVLCQAFRQAMQTIGGGPAARQLLYRLFERTLEARLGRLYRGLDRALAGRGIEPAPQRRSTERDVAERPPRSAHWARQLKASRRAVAPENEFGPGEILSALAEITGREEAWRSPRALVETLLETLRGHQRDTAPRSLPAPARRQIGLVAAWWSDLCADRSVPAPALPLLARLRPTLLEIALLDDGLFRDPDNPARRMVNELATLAEPGETEVWRRTATVVKRVGRDFRQRPAVVTAAARALGRRRPPDRAAIVDKARRMAVLELRQQALGRAPPPGIRPFLLKGWAPVLVRAYLEGGIDGPLWCTAVSRLSRLLALVQPTDYGADPEARVRAQRGLAREIRVQLLDRGVGRRRITDYLNALETAFAEANRAHAASAVPEVEAYDEPVAWDADATVFDDSGDYAAADALPEREAERAAEPLPADTAGSVLAEACRPGRWFQLHTGPDTGTRWLRLIEHDTGRGVVSFGDRRGRVALERPAAEFAEDLRLGRSRPVYDAEAFESRLAAIIGEHARDLARE